MKLDSTNLKKNDNYKALLTKSNSSRGSGHNGRGPGRGMSSRDDQQHSNQPKKDIECYYCHKKGHMEAYCYKKQREKGQVKCYFVDCYKKYKFGHVQANCYKKKREEGHASFVEEKDNLHNYLWSKSLKKNM
jgi:hypothetical protein